jgi:hypothetical protein
LLTLLGYPPSSGTDPNVYYKLNINSAASNAFTGTYPVDMETDDYIYLRINDYSTVIPQTLGDTFFTVFAKIPINLDFLVAF